MLTVKTFIRKNAVSQFSIYKMNGHVRAYIIYRESHCNNADKYYIIRGTAAILYWTKIKAVNNF